MLIDDRVPPFSEPGRPVWEPDLRLWAWVLAACAATVVGFVAGGLVGYLALCAALACAARAATRALPYGDGLREHRQ